MSREYHSHSFFRTLHVFAGDQRFSSAPVRDHFRLLQSNVATAAMVIAANTPKIPGGKASVWSTVIVIERVAELPAASLTVNITVYVRGLV